MDVTGRLVNTLVDNELDAGYHVVRWNGLDVSGQSMPSGMYFIQVQSGDRMNTQKIILLK